MDTEICYLIPSAHFSARPQRPGGFFLGTRCCLQRLPQLLRAPSPTILQPQGDPNPIRAPGGNLKSSRLVFSANKKQSDGPSLLVLLRQTDWSFPSFHSHNLEDTP